MVCFARYCPSTVSLLLTGGEDGRICATGLNGEAQELNMLPRKWMTALAAAPNGTLAFASGRSAWVRSPEGSLREFPHERSVEGVAFAPKGLRLAVARYNGVTLHWPATNGAPTELEWKGAHVSVIFSPDNRFLVTSMQENALHGLAARGQSSHANDRLSEQGEELVLERQG